MKQANLRFNYHDYLQLPEGKRYEILDGDLIVVPAPNIRHQVIGLNLKVALCRHVKDRSLGLILDAPSDIVLSPENVLQPDVVFVSNGRLSIVGPENISGAPDLVIEIFSPGTRIRDLETKRKLYARFGVREYWIVDPDAETVEVLCLTEAGYRTELFVSRTGVLHSPLFPGLNVNLTEIF